MQQEPIKLDDEFFQDPYAALARLRESGPVHRATSEPGVTGWLVVRYAEARALLADPRLGKDMARCLELFPADIGARHASPLLHHMLNADPPDHTRLRKLVSKAFTPATVARLAPRIEEITDGLLDGLVPGTETDLVTSFAYPLPITVIAELLGIPEADRARFRAWSDSFVTPPLGADIAALRQEMARYLAGLIEGKRTAPGEDLLSDLVRTSEDGDQLSVPEVVAMAFLLVVAGHETTVNLIANAVLALLRSPAQLAALRADPGLLPGAIEEFLRFDGPINIATLRFTTEPVTVGATELGAGEFVLISLLAANRDAGRFEAPAELDVSRAAAGHVAFGHGIHYCLGAPLARLEARIALGRLLDRFPGLALAASPRTPHWRNSTLIRGLDALPVRLG